MPTAPPPDSHATACFAGWRVMVVGGTRGIGRAVALGFAERGAGVAVCGRDRASLDAIASELNSRQVTTLAAMCDVTDPASLGEFVSAAAHALGGVDVLVNCASAFALSADEAAWSASMDVDLMGSVRASRLAVPYLRASPHGSIVNMASVAVLQATAQRQAYGAIKAAIVHQTASNAKALAADRIRVNCVVPGSTEFAGGIWDRIGKSDPALYQSTRDSIPLGRLGRPDDIARAVLFLASPDAGWITGQSIVVDGGQSLFGF